MQVMTMNAQFHDWIPSKYRVRALATNVVGLLTMQMR